VDVTAIPVLSDNYVFALLEPRGATAALVDPGEAEPVLEFLERRTLALEAILVTHHHGDHVAGIGTLCRRFPAARVIGASADAHRIRGLTERVREGDAPVVLGRRFEVLEVPGHTRGHIAYVARDGEGGDLFSGDTVFGATIGNLFEGTPDDIYASLHKIRALPPATRLWCAHEYTLQYVREAAAFDPENRVLVERLARLERLGPGAPTVPLTLAEERATNPFFRWDEPELCARLDTAPGLDTFRRLCELL